MAHTVLIEVFIWSFVWVLFGATLFILITCTLPRQLYEEVTTWWAQGPIQGKALVLFLWPFFLIVYFMYILRMGDFDGGN